MPLINKMRDPTRRHFIFIGATALLPVLLLLDGALIATADEFVDAARLTSKVYQGKVRHPEFGNLPLKILLDLQSPTQGRWYVEHESEDILVKYEKDRIYLSGLDGATQLHGKVDAQGQVRGKVVQNGVRDGFFKLIPFSYEGEADAQFTEKEEDSTTDATRSSMLEALGVAIFFAGFCCFGSGLRAFANSRRAARKLQAQEVSLHFSDEVAAFAHRNSIKGAAKQFGLSREEVRTRVEKQQAEKADRRLGRKLQVAVCRGFAFAVSVWRALCKPFVIFSAAFSAIWSAVSSSFSSREHQHLSDSATGEYTVVLKRVGPKSALRLGMAVDATDGVTLLLEGLARNGLVEDWNQNGNGAKVKIGDRILEVNGFRGNSSVLLRECHKPQNLTLTLQRGGSAMAETCGSSMAEGKKTSTARLQFAAAILILGLTFIINNFVEGSLAGRLLAGDAILSVVSSGFLAVAPASSYGPSAVAVVSAIVAWFFVYSNRSDSVSKSCTKTIKQPEHSKKREDSRKGNSDAKPSTMIRAPRDEPMEQSSLSETVIVEKQESQRQTLLSETKGKHDYQDKDTPSSCPSTDDGHVSSDASEDDNASYAEASGLDTLKEEKVMAAEESTALDKQEVVDCDESACGSPLEPSQQTEVGSRVECQSLNASVSQERSEKRQPSVPADPEIAALIHRYADAAAMWRETLRLQKKLRQIDEIERRMEEPDHKLDKLQIEKMEKKHDIKNQLEKTQKDLASLKNRPIHGTKEWFDYLWPRLPAEPPAASCHNSIGVEQSPGSQHLRGGSVYAPPPAQYIDEVLSAPKCTTHAEQFDAVPYYSWDSWDMHMSYDNEDTQWVQPLWMTVVNSQQYAYDSQAYAWVPVADMYPSVDYGLEFL